MLQITEAKNLTQIYNYQMNFSVPYFFSVDFDTWKKSFMEDIDGEGRTLFKELWVKAAYEGDRVVGFIQYGKTAFGFNDNGDISSEISYPVIRNFYFNKDREDAGKLLLDDAMEYFKTSEKVYAFFHYFGMSCFARHGKLFENYNYIANLLEERGFMIEHENVYYSLVLKDTKSANVQIVPHNLTKGNQQYIDFMLEGEQVGGCEVHYIDNAGAVYLRWIYVNDNITGRGIGSKCMGSLKHWLHQKGYTRFDTDTALSNEIAQYYYEKNEFIREGITRSYYL